MNKDKIILFDLDGTLLNTNELIIKSFQHTLKKVLDLEMSSEDLTPYFGETLQTTLRRFDKNKVDEMIQVYRQYNQQKHDELVKPFPKVKETLLRLNNLGCRLGIITSKSKKMCIKGLDLFQLTDLFDVIVAMEDTKHHKPSPDPILKAMEKLKLQQKNDIYYVGDSPFDIIAARSAGIVPIGVKWSERFEEIKELEPLLINSISDIEDIVSKSNTKIAK
ncbi:pyrophosphatase PpaX [Proteinivorax hydrogeniformans]|uniref:Pyrophosphatase PpaX n=1 Tax=Proteinivorax hydrogeniformans TaxID=1826727 RepID=A0AAU8HW15_9FIRM